MIVRDLLVWGGTGQAHVLADLIGSDFRIVVVVDRALDRSPFADTLLLRDEADVDHWLLSRGSAQGLCATVAIGGAYGGERRRLATFLKQRKIDLPAFIHSGAHIGSNCSIGEGTQILVGAIVATGSRVGSSVIINTGAQVDHDSRVGDGAHIGPGAVTAGEVTIGEDAFIGAGAVILPRVSIGASAIIGAGAVVVRDVPPCATVVGIPARPISTS